MSNLDRATAEVYAERQRQVSVEGYTAEHDDAHDGGELLAAALCYYREAIGVNSYRPDGKPLAWPWDDQFWKPKDKRANLVRAGGLMLAERARLKRNRGNVEPLRPKIFMVVGHLEKLLPATSTPIGTDLFRRTIAYEFFDHERSVLMRDVWFPTPYMVDAFTGSYDDGRERDMLEWCHETFGDQCFPIHGKPGLWQRGSATVNGWTWYGFSDQAALDAFVAHWPAPAEAMACP